MTMSRPDFDAPASEWLVYGDALQVAGDPRGELIGLVNGVAEKTTGAGVLDAYVRRHGKALFGFDPGDTFEPTWQYSMLRDVAIRVRAGQADPVGPLLAADIAKELRGITLVGVASEGAAVDLAPAMTTLLERAPATCKRFAFVDERARKSSMLVSRDFEPDQNLVRFGSFAPFLARAESLAIETADAQQLDLGTLDGRNVREFSLKCLRLAGYEGLDDFGTLLREARFDKLVSFELRCVEQFMAGIANEVNPYVPVYSADRFADRLDEADDGDSEGIDWTGALDGLLVTLAKCPLERLALTSFVSSGSLLEALAAAELPPSLVTLDLSDSSLDDTDVPALAAKKIGGVKHLVIERTGVSDAGADKLRAAGFEVTHSTSANTPTYRYVVGME